MLLKESWQEFVARVCYLHMFVCLWVLEPPWIRMHARASEQASECTNGAGSGRRAKQSREGDRRNTGRDREREREREGEREGGLCAVAEEQKQVAIPQEKGGASFHLLIGDLNWLQSDRGFPHSLVECGSLP